MSCAANTETYFNSIKVRLELAAVFGYTNF